MLGEPMIATGLCRVCGTPVSSGGMALRFLPAGRGSSRVRGICSCGRVRGDYPDAQFLDPGTGTVHNFDDLPCFEDKP